MINYFIGLIFLLLQSIKDIKSYEIDEKLCYLFGFIGIFYHIVLFLILKKINYLIFPLIVFLITFIFLYFLWKIGIIGGGDLKVITTISLIIPSFNYENLSIFNIFPFILLITSVICTFPFAIIYTLTKKPISFWIQRILELKKEIIFLSGFFVLMYLENIVSQFYKINNNFLIHILFIILFYNLYFKFINNNKIANIIFISFFIIDFIIDPINTIISTLVILTILIILIYLKNFRKVLSKEISVEKAKGEILNYDYFLIDEKIVKIDPFKRYLVKKGKPLVLSKASGLTEREINILKSYGIKKIEIKEKIPFVPSILLAYLILYFIWKIWQI